jgi:serine/threonine protein kinase
VVVISGSDTSTYCNKEKGCVMLHLSKVQTGKTSVFSQVCDTDTEDEDMQAGLLESSRYVSDGELIEQAVFILAQRYAFLARLSGHGSSVVYKAQDREAETLNTRDVAIKIVVVKRISIPIEIRVLSQLHNISGIQQMLRYHTFDDPMYAIVTRLEEEVSPKRCVFGNINIIKTYMKQLLTTLKAVHECNVICRDVKISNILWDQVREKLVLIDFDSATFGNRTHRVVLGTDGYLSPEVKIFENDKISIQQRRQLPGYGFAVDIYSAGIVFGQLLFSVPENHLEETTGKHWRIKLKKLLKCDHPTDWFNAYTMLQAMLCHNATDRPTCSQLLADFKFIRD